MLRAVSAAPGLRFTPLLYQISHSHLLCLLLGAVLPVAPTPPPHHVRQRHVVAGVAPHRLQHPLRADIDDALHRGQATGRASVVAVPPRKFEFAADGLL